MQVFIKSELKVGVIYVKENQYSEEQILDNNTISPLFDEFLQVLGDKVRLKGFDKYKGGLDTVHDLTGKAITQHLSSFIKFYIQVYILFIRSGETLRLCFMCLLFFHMRTTTLKNYKGKDILAMILYVLYFWKLITHSSILPVSKVTSYILSFW